ncbi:MAG: AraC family transcriptional regulator ligand-binding domain-containing protein [Sphingomonadaceae bacterium]
MQYFGRDSILINSHSARIMSTVLREQGLDLDDILSSIGLNASEIADPDCLITVAQEIAFQRLFVKHTANCPGLWYEIGLRYGVLSYGSLGQASLCAGTVREALDLFVRAFQDLNYSLLKYELVSEAPGELIIETTDDNVGEDLRLFCQERSLGSVERLLSDFAPGQKAFVRIESALPAKPIWLSEPTLSGVPITFGHARSRWFIVPALLDMRMPLANETLGTSYRLACDKAVERMNAQNDIVARVYHLLENGTLEDCSIGRVASELSLHERTLQRKLAEAHIKFSDLVVQVRQDKAKQLLRNSQIQVAQIAEVLGFTEIASFSHAFKRWTGMSPLDFRKAARGG